ncbi:hypothetical protein JCM11251_006496 [Rhodosporidiobolus azoricus]
MTTTSQGAHNRSRSSSRPTPGGGGGTHGRSTSASSSHHGGREGIEGAYVPPVHSSDADFDFCNAFWLTPARSRINGNREGDEGEEKDWGKEGYETLMSRVKTGTRGLEELRGVLKERASAAEDYSKRLHKLSKHSFGTGETGHLERAILTLKNELAQSAQSQTELAQLMRGQEGMVGEFVGKREGGRKNQQTAIEKTWKQLQNQREHVLKAKAKYEQDAIQINALHAQASLLQGRELDKETDAAQGGDAQATLKLDKVQQTVAVNERDYRNYVAVLKETTVNWNMSWKTFCDLVQDQEEERLEFVKARLWDFANGLSTLAMAEDESAERTRTALEQCDPKIDVRIFVQQFGTGNAIPDPIPFHDVKSQTAAPKQAYRTARFQRSSTRLPGVRHSPSAVNDIASQIGRSVPPPAGVQGRRPSQPDLQQAGGTRPPSRSVNHASHTSLSTAVAAAPSPQQEPAPSPVATARPAPSALQQPDPSASPAGSGRFAVSPSANLRASFSGSEHAPRPVSPGGTARPGHISAGAFQNRQSMVVSPSLAAASAAAPSAPATSTPARYEAPSSTPPSALPPPVGKAKPPAASAAEEEDDDPLLKALKVLQNTPISEPSRMVQPQNRMSQGPPSGVSGQRSSVDLRGQAASPPQQYHQQHRSQASLSLAHAQSPQHQQHPPSRSRPSSPAPHASMMQSPPSSQLGTNPGAMYGQAFPAERSRPHSRQGSTVSSAVAPQQPGLARPASVVGGNLASPPSVGNFGARPSSPGPNRGRSPSPQPYIPESLRPASPRPGMYGQPPQQRAASPSPQVQQQPVQRPASGLGQSPSMGGYGQPQAPYGAPPPPQQQPQQGYPAGAPPPVLSQQQQHVQPGFARATSPQSPAPFAAYAPPPSQHQQPAPQQAYMPPQQPSQHFSPQHQQQQQPYPHQHVLGANGYAYPVQQQAPPPAQQQQQPMYGQPPASAYASPPPSASQAHLARTPSTHSGVSGVSIQQTPMTAYQPQVQQRPASVVSVGGRAPPAPAQAPNPPPPTGQYSDSGQPILFYVNALYDYAAASPEEFSFSTADVIAVTATDPDGWWQGFRVGSNEGSKVFPSNFTELLP